MRSIYFTMIAIIYQFEFYKTTNPKPSIATEN